MGANGHRGRVAVPINTTSQVEVVVGENLEVVRTPASLPELTRVAAEEGVIFAGAAGGGYVFPEFLPAYDAMASPLQAARAAGASTRRSRCPQIAGELPRQTLIHREVALPVGAQGHGHAGAERALHRMPTSTCATGSRSSTTAAGSRCCRTPTSRSSTSTPRGARRRLSEELEGEIACPRDRPRRAGGGRQPQLKALEPLT